MRRGGWWVGKVDGGEVARQAAWGDGLATRRQDWLQSNYFDRETASATIDLQERAVAWSTLCERSCLATRHPPSQPVDRLHESALTHSFSPPTAY